MASHADLRIPAELIAARGLVPSEEATTLECAETGPDGRRHLLVPEAARAWRSLKAAATSEGIDVFIVSAFRSVERQKEIIRAKLDQGLAIDAILTVCAPPGFSEHHTGRAVDLGTPGSEALEIEFEKTEAYSWLRERAGAYGFRLSYPAGNASGYQYEPWHWCYHFPASA